MCTLLKVANRRPVDLISPLLVHKEQITSVGFTGDNSAVLACFSCTVRCFSALSVFFMRFPRFGPFSVRATPRTHWSSSATQCNASAMHCGCGPQKLRIICPPLGSRQRQVQNSVNMVAPQSCSYASRMEAFYFALTTVG